MWEIGGGRFQVFFNFRVTFVIYLQWHKRYIIIFTHLFFLIFQPIHCTCFHQVISPSFI
jgi:hypothetical protein